MPKSQNLFDIADVCAYFGLSESTVRRRVRESRDGQGNFPLPLFGSGCRVLWRKSDIENWRGEDGEVITFTPSLIPPTSKAILSQSKEQVRKGLEALGIKLPPTGTELNKYQKEILR